jgi:replicative DNA helicase
VKKSGALRLWDASQQLKLLDDDLHDERPAIPTGLAGIDSLLRRGGLLPGNLVLLGGRTGTRKTTLMLNMMVNMVEQGIPVALVGLDEPPPYYVSKLLSVFADMPQERLEALWDTEEGKTLRQDWKDIARRHLFMFGGHRPAPHDLDAAMEMAEMGGARRPRVIFLDYLSKMSKTGDYAWGENSRIPALMDDLAVWTTETGTIMVVLHQLSRNDEYGGTNNRNAGHVPMTLTQLRNAGEEPADLVLGTYRPELDPLAAMSMDIARMVLGDRFDEEEYWARQGRAQKYRESTFVQLLKNRPGTHREERGVEMLSRTESLRMEEKEADEPEREDEDEAHSAREADERRVHD